MYRYKRLPLLSFVTLLCLSLWACQKNGPQPEYAHSFEVASLTPLPEAVSASGISLNNPMGVLILSEGNFSNEAGHLSFVLPESKHYANGLIRAINGRHLGSVTQDLAINQGKLYILSRNGRKQGQGEMAHISVFDKDFRFIEDYAPDVAVDANLQDRPERIAVAHQSIYFYAGGVLYQCDTEGSTKGNCEIVIEVQSPLPERIYTARRSSGEYVYALGKHRVYQINESTDVNSYALPRSYEALSMSLSPRLANSDDVYAWVLARETVSHRGYIIKLRNLEQEGIYPINMELGQAQASKFSLVAYPLKSGTLLYFKDKGTLYRFDTEGQKLSSIYQSGRGGANIFYGYIGVDPHRNSIYLSEFEDYPLYNKAWVSELGLDGKLKHKFPIVSRGDIGLSTEGIYTPFCAGIYPLAMLYRY